MHYRVQRLLIAVVPLLIVFGFIVAGTGVAAAADHLVSNPHVNEIGANSVVVAADIEANTQGTWYVQYREVGATEWQSTESETFSGTGEISRPVRGLDPGTTYEFRVVAEEWEPDWTEAATFTTAEEGEDGSGDGIAAPIVGAINDLKETIKNTMGGESIADAIVRALFAPFLALAKAMLDTLVALLMTTPSVYPNEAVQDVHQRVLLVTYLLATPAFMLAGLLYMTGPVLGFEYAQVRRMLPRLLVALIFGTVSLPLLQLGVDFTNALTAAFHQQGVFMSLPQAVGLSAGLVLVWFIQAIVLLVVTVVFIIRGAYILFVAAISPLIALAWAIPPTKQYADTFISGWFTALAMAPLDVLVLRFVLELFQGQYGVLTSVDNWVFGTAGLILLVLVPQQLYGVSQSALGLSYALGRGMQRRYRRHQSNESETQQPRTRRRPTRIQPGQGRRRHPQRENKFPKDRILNHRNDDD